MKEKSTFDLRKDADKRGVLLVAHRGVWGGNVPPNTIAAYDTALAQGADMLEIDLNRTADGKAKAAVTPAGSPVSFFLRGRVK